MNRETEARTQSPSSPSPPRLQLPASCDPPGPENPPQQRVWVIFGATGHIGRSLTKAALGHNDRVTAVGRTFEDTPESMQELHPVEASPHGSQPRSQFFGLLCDVRVRPTVEAVFQTSLAHWGRIDIIANCSGHGVVGACEDQDDYEIRNQFETNFWGTLNILQLSLPYFREHKRGRYIIFSSTSGALGVPGLGPYCATKYAVEGLVESMLYETNAFNIRATLVEPGHVRRDEPPDRNSKSHPLSVFGHFSIKSASEPYSSPTAPAAHAKRMLQWIGDRQPTSAVKAAELVWQLGHCQYPPLRLLLGTFAVESVRDRLRCVTEEIEDWKHLSFKPEGEESARKASRGVSSHDEDAMREDDAEWGEEGEVKVEEGKGQESPGDGDEEMDA